MNLSPLTMAGISANQYLGEYVRPSEKKRIREVVRYECTTCGELHEWEDEAEECCEETKLAEATHFCPVCAMKHIDVDSAAECCLWKDLEFGARYKVARAVENGQSWTEAISGVGG